MSTHTEKELRDKVIEAIKDHARSDSNKVISNVRINWTRSGYELRISEYAVEYMEKPVSYGRAKT